MKNGVHLILISFAILIFACRNEVDTNNDPSISKITYIKSTSRLNDSTFFECRGIVEKKNKLFATDFKNGRILCLDNDLNLLYAFGRKGRGPEEFNGLSHLYIDDKKLFIQDWGNRRFALCNLNGEFIKTIKYGTGFRDTRFICNDSSYYYFRLGEEYPIGHTKFDGHVINTFGTYYPKCNNYKFDKDEFYSLNITEDDNILATARYSPIIYMYSKTGEFITSLDLSKNKFIKERIRLIEDLLKEPIHHGGRGAFFRDSYYFNKKLYILGYAEHTKQCNKIFIIDVNHNQLSISNNILALENKFENARYSTFCVFSSKGKEFLIAFDFSTYELHKFEI